MSIREEIQDFLKREMFIQMDENTFRLMIRYKICEDSSYYKLIKARCNLFVKIQENECYFRFYLTQHEEKHFPLDLNIIKDYVHKKIFEISEQTHQAYRLFHEKNTPLGQRGVYLLFGGRRVQKYYSTHFFCSGKGNTLKDVLKKALKSNQSNYIRLEGSHKATAWGMDLILGRFNALKEMRKRNKQLLSKIPLLKHERSVLEQLRNYLQLDPLPLQKFRTKQKVPLFRQNTWILRKSKNVKKPHPQKINIQNLPDNDPVGQIIFPQKISPKWVSFDYKNLIDIEEGHITSLYITFRSNCPEDVPPVCELLQQLRFLKKITLAVHSFEALKSILHALKDHPITTLDITLSTIDQIPKVIGKFKHLQVFIADKEDIPLPGSNLNKYSFPKEFAQLNHLESIFLGDQHLETIPEVFMQLKSLKTLDLQKCDIRTIPKQFQNLKQLESLNLRNNSIKDFSGLCHLPSLKHLNLGFNALRQLPEKITTLTSLQNLNLELNLLKTLPYSLWQLKNLESLNVNENHLVSLPKSLEGLKHLTYLNINHNNLKYEDIKNEFKFHHNPQKNKISQKEGNFLYKHRFYRKPSQRSQNALREIARLLRYPPIKINITREMYDIFYR